MYDFGYIRGHEMYCKNDEWFYCDNDEPVAFNNERDCGYCGLANTPEGHDGCLGTLPGVRNACCGHGNYKRAYIQYEDLSDIREIDAINEMNRLGRNVSYE